MTQLGDTLSDERRRQGRSLVDVEAATRIRARMLEALEHGDYDLLPAPAYVKGYIQSYAGYLDIPVQPLLDLYRADVRFADERAEEREHPLMPRGARYSNVSRQNLDELPAVQSVVPRREQAHAIPTRTWLIAAAAIVGVLLAFWAISRLLAQPASVPPVPPSVVTTSTTEPTSSAVTSSTTATGSTPVTPVAPTGTPAPRTPGGTSAESTANVKPFKLAFRVVAGIGSGHTHLKLTVDGAVLFDQNVTLSTSIPTFTVYRGAVAVVGAPIYVVITKDGVHIATPNTHTAYTLTLKNTNPAR